MQVQHVLPSLGLPIIIHCTALWTFVFILIAEWEFSFSLSWLQNDDHPHLSALGSVHLQPALALVTFCTSGASMVSCSFLFAGDYKLQNFSPWPHAVTRKHILPPLTHCLLQVIAGCIIISPVNNIHTVVQSHVTGVALQLELCFVSLCVMRWHLWCKMCWGIKTSLLVCHQKKNFFSAATSCFFFNIIYSEIWVTKADNMVHTFSCKMADTHIYSNRNLS